MINALLEKPSFKQAVQKRRCLVPANGFYEWRRDGNRKIPMWIQFRSREPFAFPGLWDCWVDRETGKPLYSFTIITSHGNALLRRILRFIPKRLVGGLICHPSVSPLSPQDRLIRAFIALNSAFRQGLGLNSSWRKPFR
jgi:hypothetical protein